LLFETNSKEVSGFFQNFFFTPATLKTVIIVGVLLTITIIGERYNKKITKFASKPITMCIISVILLIGCIGGVGATQRYWDLAQSKRAYDAEVWIRDKPFYHIMPLPNLCYSFAAINLAEKDLANMIEATENCLKDIRPVESDSLNIILVIGESFNKYHSALYGYPLDTTPFESEEQAKGNLHAFTQIEAPFNMTSIVLKNMFCCNSVFEGEKWHDFPFFPAIFKKAGYDVWLWDNQYQVNQDLPWNFTLNSIIFNQEIQNLSFTDVNQNCYALDKDLIQDFKRNKMSQIGKHNLVIFHLYGQHMPASTQYPQDNEHQVFSIDEVPYNHSFLTNESKQEIVEYDNATRYNDEVIKYIIDIFKDKSSILVYFSDHGEEVYDYRNYHGRVMLENNSITPSLIKYQIEVPFMVWASEKWQKQNLEDWQNIGLAVDKAFTTDNICHLLFHLAGIKTNIYKAERDLFSPKFEQAKKHDIMLAL